MLCDYSWALKAAAAAAKAAAALQPTEAASLGHICKSHTGEVRQAGHKSAALQMGKHHILYILYTGPGGEGGTGHSSIDS